MLMIQKPLIKVNIFFDKKKLLEKYDKFVL